MYRNTPFLGVSCSLALILVLSAFSPLHELLQAKDRPEPLPSLPVACSVDKPVVFEGDTVLLRTWVTVPRGLAPEYTWTAGAGQINGRGHEVRWSFTGVRPSPRPYEARVKVTVPSTGSGNCSLQVLVAEIERGERETGRTLLVKGKKETEGYGLYSYLLLGSRPTASTRERYVNAIEAYLGQIEDVTKLEDYIPRSRLNVTYIPVEAPPPAARSANWLLDNYDYARARALLDVLRGNLREGPYIVSSLKPLGSDKAPNQYLFQDLSAVPAAHTDLIAWWVREFLNQAAQERFWEPRTGELLVLKTRTTIGALAIGLPEVQKALESWISWIH